MKRDDDAPPPSSSPLSLRERIALTYRYLGLRNVVCG